MQLLNRAQSLRRKCWEHRWPGQQVLCSHRWLLSLSSRPPQAFLLFLHLDPRAHTWAPLQQMELVLHRSQDLELGGSPFTLLAPKEAPWDPRTKDPLSSPVLEHSTSHSAVRPVSSTRAHLTHARMIFPTDVILRCFFLLGTFLG